MKKTEEGNVEQQLELIVEESLEIAVPPAAAEIIQLTVEQLGEVGGGVAYIWG